MKFCTGCGTQIDDNAIFCHACGKRVNGDVPHSAYGAFTNDIGTSFVFRIIAKVILAIVCFSFPPAGLVLWFLWRERSESLDLAKVSGISAIIGAVLTALGYAFLLVISFLVGDFDFGMTSDMMENAGALFGYFRGF